MADGPPSQSSIHALHTATPNWGDLPQRSSTYKRPFTHEGNYLVDFSDPEPKADTEQTTDIDKVPFSKLQIGQDNQKEEPLEVTESLVPPPPITEASDNTVENTNGEELMEAEKRLQREEEKYYMYDRIYVGQLSDEEDSSMNTNETSYTYFR